MLKSLKEAHIGKWIVQALWLVQGLNFKQWVVIKEYPNATRHWLIHYSLKVFFLKESNDHMEQEAYQKTSCWDSWNSYLRLTFEKNHSKNHYAFDQLGQTVSKPCVMPNNEIQRIFKAVSPYQTAHSQSLFFAWVTASKKCDAYSL